MIQFSLRHVVACRVDARDRDEPQETQVVPRFEDVVLGAEEFELSLQVEPHGVSTVLLGSGLFGGQLDGREYEGAELCERLELSRHAVGRGLRVGKADRVQVVRTLPPQRDFPLALQCVQGAPEQPARLRRVLCTRGVAVQVVQRVERSSVSVLNRTLREQSLDVLLDVGLSGDDDGNGRHGCLPSSLGGCSLNSEIITYYSNISKWETRVKGLGSPYETECHTSMYIYQTSRMAVKSITVAYNSTYIMNEFSDPLNIA